MSIKKELEGRYREYVGAITADGKLKLSDKGMLLNLLGLPDDFSLDTRLLAGYAVETAATIQRCIDRLERNGNIRLSFQRVLGEDGGKQYTRWVVEMVFPEKDDVEEKILEPWDGMQEKDQIIKFLGSKKMFKKILFSHFN